MDKRITEKNQSFKFQKFITKEKKEELEKHPQALEFYRFKRNRLGKFSFYIRTARNDC